MPALLREPEPRNRMDSLLDDILDLSHIISAAGDMILADLGITHAHWQVLKWAAGGEERTAAAIAESLRHSRQAAQRIVNELRDRDLIRIGSRLRPTFPQQLDLTPDGWEIYANAEARIQAWCDHLQARFKRYELERGLEFIVRLKDETNAVDEVRVVECRGDTSVIPSDRDR